MALVLASTKSLERKGRREEGRDRERERERGPH